MAHGDVAGGFPSGQVTAVGGWICFEDEAGAWLNSPVRRTWGKAGHTPVLRMSGKRNDKISMVAWACFKEGVEPRLIYAIKPSGGYTKKDFPRFLTLLHRRLAGPVTVVWDKCAVRRFVVSPTHSGGIWRNIPGPPGLPGGESRRGQQHVRKAVTARRRSRRCVARPARYGQSWIA